MKKILKNIMIGGAMILSSATEGAKAQTKSAGSDALEPKQSKIVGISAFAAIGNQQQLSEAITEALDAGLSINEIKEILVHLYAYTGFPRSLNTISTLEKVTTARKQKGINDTMGKEPSPVDFSEGKYEYGKQVVTKLTGSAAIGAPQRFAPIIDTFLKEHLFASIFSRDNLDFISREIATISALASMSGVENQFRAHLNVGRNLGISEAQLREIAFTIATKIGWKEGSAAINSINRMFNSGGTKMNTKPNGISVQKVMFPNRDITIAANLFLPAGFDASKKYPAIVVGHPFGGVKEQTAGLYAEKLAEKGYVTLAFDASYQGESGGYPRFLEDPEIRTEDYRAAADYITTRDFTDPTKVAVLGICGGGGFAIHAAQTEHRFKAVATISMVDGGDLRRNGVKGSLTPTIQQRLDEVAKQRIIETNGGPIRYNNYVANTREEIPANASPMYVEGYDYYRVTHKQETAPNKYMFTSLDKLINFTALDHVELISPRPLLVIAGSKADTYYYSQQAYDRARSPREFYVVEGATHIQLYWKPEYVARIVDKLDDFYNKNLNGTK